MNIKSSFNLILLLTIVSCNPKAPIMLTEGGDGTETIRNQNSAQVQYSNQNDVFDGIMPEMTREEVLSKFGEPRQIEMIRGREFYLYSHSSEKSNFYLFVLFSEDKVYEFSNDRTRISEYPNGEDYFPEIIDETRKRVSIHDMYQEFEVSTKIVVANFESRSTVPVMKLNAAQIEELVNMINAKSDFYYIVGHTHNQGSKEGNLKLSIERAEAVIQLLENEYDLESNKLTATGEGEENPLFDNNTKEGRILNSRVEIGMKY